MKLIINGDDLGYTRGNTYGIFQAYTDGILRSTTALMNSRYIEEAAETAKQYPELGIGVHLTLTLGRPLTENRTLRDENGDFYKGARTVWQHDPDYDEIYLEWKAQIDRYIKVFGHLPTHFDSHHFVHTATPEALKTAQRLSEEYGLPMRGFSSYTFVHTFGHDHSSPKDLIAILEEHCNEDIEIMCHPGWCDLDLYRMSSYNTGRVQELDTLCSDEVREYLELNGIETVHY